MKYMIDDDEDKYEPTTNMPSPEVIKAIQRLVDRECMIGINERRWKRRENDELRVADPSFALIETISKWLDS